jgi:hypothetical protein
MRTGLLAVMLALLVSIPWARSSQTICFPKIIAQNCGSVIGDAFLASPDKQEHNLGYSENRRGRA